MSHPLSATTTDMLKSFLRHAFYGNVDGYADLTEAEQGILTPHAFEELAEWCNLVHHFEITISVRSSLPEDDVCAKLKDAVDGLDGVEFLGI